MPQVVNGTKVYTPAELGIKPPSGGFKEGGWYNGRQYWNGVLSEPGVINPYSNQIGAGQAVSKEVIQQTNPANWDYIQKQRQQANLPPLPTNTPTVSKLPTQPSIPPAQPSIPSGTGVSLQNLMPQKPTINLEDLYKKYFEDPAIKNLENQINQRKDAFSKAMNEINDNPFYSEATRVGRVAKLQDQANRDIQQLQDELAKKKADAEVKLNLSMKQYDINSQDYKEKLNMFNDLLGKGALINATGGEIASFATALGVPTSFIDSIVQQQRDEIRKKNETEPKIITSTDDAGNVTVVAIDAKTGNIINKTSLGNIGKADNTSSRGGSGGGSSGGLTATQQRTILAKAGKILKNIDENYRTVNGKLIQSDIPKGDSYLSSLEVIEAVKRLMMETGVDQQTAANAIDNAFVNLGFKKWKF
jgi:hypothetical protein